MHSHSADNWRDSTPASTAPVSETRARSNAVRSSFGTFGGTKLHWTERGQGSTIVILHGMQDTERTWWRVADALAGTHRVLALDLPGCGLSGRPDASYTLDWQAQVVAIWMARVGSPSLDLVGHSYGGGLALWLLLYRADQIRRLALVAPGGFGHEVGLPLRLASLPWLVDHLGQPWMGPAARLMTRLHGGGLPKEERAYLRRVNATPGTARAFARTARDVIAWRGQTRHLLDRARDISSLPPIALLWGDRDHIIPIQHGERALTLLDNSILYRFSGHGHFLHWTAPGVLADALLDYFDSRRARNAVLRRAIPLGA